ncbi:Hypothetical_protein [Hexamita inflata]|uniref:Hypothetical_protein n=1 Tax=Hexamita inflata TaxID=28002 RepID=A0AA86QG89_9EUKA|nr:Hypothetical protein HINF_LOCUS38725 [Hexamita inflata]
MISEAEQRGYYMNPYQTVNNRHSTQIDPFGGSTVTYQQPRASLAGYKPQWKISTDEYAISPHTSMLMYEGLFTFKFPSAGKYELIGGYWYFTQAVLDTSVTPNKYTYSQVKTNVALNITQDGSTKMISASTATATQTYVPYRKCVAESALNAFAPIMKTVPQYSSPLNIDDQIYIRKTIEQTKYSNQYQNTNNRTWFGGDEPAWVVEWFPSKLESNKTRTYISELDYAATKGTLASGDTDLINDTKDQCTLVNAKTGTFNYAYIQVKKAFELPFMLLNAQFDVEQNIYLNALKNQPLTLIIEFVNQQFAYCFDHSGKVLVDGVNQNNVNRTGIISHKLYLDTKCDPDYLSDSSVPGLIENKFIAYEAYTIGNCQPVTGTTSETIDRCLTSVNDIIITFQPTTTEQCEMFRQQSTFFPSKVCVDIQNGNIDSAVELVFPHKFQIYRQGGNDPIFTEAISSIHMFMMEFQKMQNYQMQREYQMPNEFKSIMEWARKYAMIGIGLQQFTADLPVDVILDGINNSGATKIRMSYELATYNEFSEYPIKYNATNTIANKTAIENYDCLCFLNYDAFVKIFPTNSKMIVEQTPTK